jgi:UDP-N-acetylglucosamine acyltransferase
VNIHPTAVVSPKARLGQDVEIGPFCVVEPEASLGDGCILESRVTIKRGATLGKHNRVFDGTVLGGLPQHVHVPDVTGSLLIGDGNTLRENVTIHRALAEGQATVVGHHNLIMVNSHVAHDCRLGDYCILANNVMLAGHVQVDDRAYVSGAVGVHQFCRVGRLAMVGGQAHVVKDVPPFVTVDGVSTRVVGLNLVGLRRAGFQPAEIAQLKAAYRVIFRSGQLWETILAELSHEFTSGPAAEFAAFFRHNRRGFTPARQMPEVPTIKLPTPDAEPKAKAG